MQIVFGFLFGLLMGPFLFNKYLVNHIPKEKFLPAKITVAPTPSIRPVITSSEIQVEELTSEVYSMEIENSGDELTISVTPDTPITTTPTPTKKNSPTYSKRNIPTPTNAPTKTPTPSPSNTPTVTPTPTRQISQISVSSVTPTAVNTQRRYTSQEINGFIDVSSSHYNVDSNVLRHIALCESNFNNLAQSRNGLYAGLYQFSAGTWGTFRKRMSESVDPELRFNAMEAVKTAAYVMSVGKSTIWPNCVP